MPGKMDTGTPKMAEKSLELSELDRETLNEYLITYEYQSNRIEMIGMFFGNKNSYSIILSCGNRRFP